MDVYAQADALPDAVTRRARMQHLSAAGIVSAVTGFQGVSAARGLGGDGVVARVGLDPSDAAGAVGWHTALAGLLELDDHLLRSRSCAAVAAAAWASAGRSSLAEVLAATVAGNEVAGRVGLATALGSPGWGCPAATAAGVAVTGGLLGGLDEDGLAQAVSIALASASWDNTPSADGLAMAEARAASEGMRAVSAARNGATSAEDILDRVVEKLSWMPLHGAFSGMGRAWLTDTISHRRFACAPAAVTAVESVAEILARHVKAADKRLRTDQVERIEIHGAAMLGAMASSGALEPASIPWSLPEALGVLVARHDLGAADLAPEVLAAQAERIRHVAERVEVFVQPSRTAEALTAQIEVIGPLFADLGWRDARRMLSPLRSAAALSGGEGRGMEGVRSVARLLRAAVGLRRVSGAELSAIDVASWQLHLPVEVQLYTTRGGRWPERRSLPEGSPGADWSHTCGFVFGRFEGTGREEAAQRLHGAAPSSVAWPLLAAAVGVSADS